jgi:energy-coupling factor transport system ATP-binding protein
VTAALNFVGVTFRYPDSDRLALTDVTTAIDEGVFALVVGPTGAGKSTLLRAANGLVPHFSGGRFAGRVEVRGRDTLAHAPRELADVVAFVPQDPASSFVVDRVEDELAYGMENLGVGEAPMRRRVEEMLDLLHLAPLRDRSVRTLSGGERQRVAIGAALAAGPRILVLDEPTSQLDPQGAEDVLAALQRLVHDHAMTVLVAEHRLERVAGFADVAIGCDEGRVRAGTPGRVLGEAALGPPVTRLGGELGWDPLPLTVREARPLAGALRITLPGVTAPVPRGEALVRARGIRAGYGDAEAIRGVDFELSEGEVVALMGRNGAGKTTLLRTLAGVHRPAAGTVDRGDGRAHPGERVALCPQDPDSVLFKDRVDSEVGTTLRARGRPGPPGPILSLLGIEGLANRHPRDLSSGQRLLVAVASIVATGAPALLLDEPTRGLDPQAKEHLAAFLHGFATAGQAAVVATHDVELAAEVATRVVLLAEGEVVADGSPGDVLGDSTVFAPQMTRLMGPGWLTVDQVARAVSP